MALEALNKIKHFEEGGSTGGQETAPATNVGVEVKSAPSKSGISPVGTQVLTPEQTAELLTNMEKLIAQKTGPYATLMSGVQDALAYATPQAGGQQALALQYRNQQKRQEMEDIFGMREKMAAINASTQQAQADQERYQNAMAGGAGGVGGAGGMSADEMALLNSVPERQRPAVWQQIMKDRATQSRKTMGDVNYYEQKPFDVPGRGTFMMNRPQIEEFNRTGRIPDDVGTPGLQGAAKGAPQMQSDFAKLVERTEASPAGSVSPKGATTTMQVMPGTARAPGYGVRPAANSSPEEVKRVGNDYADAMLKRYKGDTEAALIAYNAGPTVADKFLASGRDPAVLTKETIDYLARANQIQTAKPTQVAAASTGTATDAQPPTRRSGEPVDVFKKRQELWQKQQETDIATRAQSGGELRKKAGDMIAAVEQNAKNADEVIRTADRVIQHATKYPKEFGYSYQQENPVLAGAANLPGIGTVVEKAVPAMFGAPSESKRRSVTDADARKLGLDFAAQMFSGTGARLGVGLEQMAANAKGVGTELPAETNALNANLVKVAAEKAKEQAEAWRKWRTVNGGENADPYSFMQSEENKRITEKYDRKLDAYEEQAKKIYPEFFGEKPTKANRKPLGAILGGQ